MTMQNIAHATEMARARLNLVLTERLLQDFDTNGGEVIAWFRKKRPIEYFKMVTVALPKVSAANESSARQVKSRHRLLAWMFRLFGRR